MASWTGKARYRGSTDRAICAKGYVVGPKVQKACDAGASGQAGSGLVCYVALAAIGVARDDATYACSEAAK
jgi:hypothetical protein